MNLRDGLQEYRRDRTLWALTQALESETAPRILTLLGHFGDSPTQEAQSEAKTFLLKVEEWKSLCNPEHMINAVQNSPRKVWNALRGAVTASTYHDALAAIMTMRGFGAAADPETGQRRAKMATAVLRFLDPFHWGVVDWRNAAMLGALDRAEWKCDRALEKARRQRPQEMREILDIIDAPAAIEMNHRYRSLAVEYSLAGAAEVDMAIFGLSLIAWPMPPR